MKLKSMMKASLQPIVTRKGITLLLVLACFLLAGALGYEYLEGWSFSESFYMTVITLSTVGFGEVRELSPEGRLFTTALIVGGAVYVTYMFGVVSEFIISGELSGRFRRHKMDKKVAGLRDHYIVCGEGRVGRQVGWDLRRHGAHCVLIDPAFDAEVDDDPDYLTIAGNAEDDAVLIRAGVERARALVAVTGEDPTNMFITMSAKAINPQMMVVARANYVSSRAKLKRAGADLVVSPYVLSGQRIASMMTSPALAEFIDGLTAPKGHGMKIAEFVVPVGSGVLRDAQWNERVTECGVTVLGVKDHETRSWVTSDVSAQPLTPGDSVIAIGRADSLSAVEQVIGPIDPVQASRFRRLTAGQEAEELLTNG